VAQTMKGLQQQAQAGQQAAGAMANLRGGGPPGMPPGMPTGGAVPPPTQAPKAPQPGMPAAGPPMPGPNGNGGLPMG
jgi:hypothetical protein